MIESQNTSSASSDPETLVRDRIERGISQAREGETAAAVGSFTEAESLASDAGLTSLSAGAAINRGWALWLAGERDEAVAAYQQGARTAREAGDAQRLRIALSNLGIALLEMRRYADAATVYEEYVPLAEQEPREQVEAHVNWAIALEGLGRRDEAFEHYWNAFDIADDASDADLVGTVTMALGGAYTRANDHPHAADCFGEAARAFRYLEDEDRLAAALHEHGRSLQRVGLIDQALEVWREEEPILREKGDDLALGECLLQQALATGGQTSNFSADLQFTEAAAAFERAGALERLPEVFQAHAQWLRERFMDRDARKRVEQALAALGDAPDPAAESRALGLQAQMLSDDKDFVAAAQALEEAEVAARRAGDAEAATGVLVRRAYVMAREGRAADEVRAQLDVALEHARSHGHEARGRFAVEAVAAEIEERCGAEYSGLSDGSPGDASTPATQEEG